MRKSKGCLELHNYIKELKMYENNRYPAVEKFLRTQKNCIAEYVGTELSQKRGKTSLRADVFGVSNDGENPYKNRH